MDRFVPYVTPLVQIKGAFILAEKPPLSSSKCQNSVIPLILKCLLRMCHQHCNAIVMSWRQSLSIAEAWMIRTI